MTYCEPGRIRTCDQKLKRLLLYQLSYGPPDYYLPGTFTATTIGTGRGFPSTSALKLAASVTFSPPRYVQATQQTLTVYPESSESKAVVSLSYPSGNSATTTKSYLPSPFLLTEDVASKIARRGLCVHLTTPSRPPNDPCLAVSSLPIVSGALTATTPRSHLTNRPFLRWQTRPNESTTSDRQPSIATKIFSVGPRSPQ